MARDANGVHAEMGLQFMATLVGMARRFYPDEWEQEPQVAMVHLLMSHMKLFDEMPSGLRNKAYDELGDLFDAANEAMGDALESGESHDPRFSMLELGKPKPRKRNPRFDDVLDALESDFAETDSDGDEPLPN